MKPIIVAAAAILSWVSLCNSASADWQWTKWGMSPAQVKVASNGSAAETTTVEADENSPKDGSYRALLKGPYRSGKFLFDAIFEFKDSASLCEVRLTLREGGGQTLVEALQQKYGNPTSSQIMLKGMHRSFQWLTDRDNIRAIWIEDTNGKSPGGFVSLTYSARVDPNNAGL